MLKFFAILGSILATLVALFMVAVNFGFLEPKEEPVDPLPRTVQEEQADNLLENKEEPVAVVVENGYVNGVYTASEPDYDVTTGWKKTVKVEVKNGKVYDVRLDEEYKDKGRTKKDLSKSGEYMMTEDSEPWHEQIMDAEDVLMDMSDPEDIMELDAISSVTIDSSVFLNLVRICLEEAKEQ